MPQTGLGANFLASFELHSPMDHDEVRQSLDEYASGDDDVHAEVVNAARHMLAIQALRGLLRDLTHLQELQDGFPEEVLHSDSNLAVLLALLIVGREQADGGVFVAAGPQTIGDHLDGLSEMRVDVGIQQGDFDVEFLITWNEQGPNPEHYTDESQPVGLYKTYRVALICDQSGPGEPNLVARKTRRIGLESMGLMVETYTDTDASNDPFGLVIRTIKRIQRHVLDDYTQ